MIVIAKYPGFRWTIWKHGTSVAVPPIRREPCRGCRAGQLGNGIAAAGDLNADGIDDFVLGAPLASPEGHWQAGISYVVFGNANGLPEQIDLTALDGTNGFAIEGIATKDRSGWSVAGAGDVNDDGIDDLLIGAPGATREGRNNTGEVYIVFGRDPEEVAVDLHDFVAQQEANSVVLQWTMSAAALHEVRAIHVQRRLDSQVTWMTLSDALVPQTTMQYQDKAFDSPQDVQAWYRLLLTLSDGERLLSAALRIALSPQLRTYLGPPTRSAGGVSIHYGLARPANVQLQVFDVRGRLVHTFAPGIRSAGGHAEFWDTSSGLRGQVSPGIYFLHLRAESDAAARKIVLTKE